MKKKIIRACTVSMSVGFVKGMLPDLTKKYEVVLLSSPGPEMDEAREQYGVRTIEVPMERHISPVKDFLSLCRLIRVFLKEKPDMVHSMTPKAGLLCMTAAWLTSVPVRIHTFTGLVWPTSTGLKRRILMLTDAITCWCATHVIPEGEGVKADLMNNGITRKPLRILGYGNVRGIDMERFSVLSVECSKEFSVLNVERSKECSVLSVERSKECSVLSVECSGQNSKLKTFTFLFVGRIVGDKGINELVEAFCRLNSEMPETRLVLVGFYEQNLDPVSEETHRMIEENPNIIMAGERTGDDLVRSYAEADCFVFPSYREGFPNTVLEAGAMGLPSIVTDINGSREIITDIFSHADLADTADSLTTDDTDIFCHADLADHADNLYFDHGSTRIHTDDNLTHAERDKTTDDTENTNDNLTHADLADHADNLYFDHGSTRIHTDDNLTHTAITEKRETTDDTDIFSHADLADHAENLYFDHGSTRIHTDDNLTHADLADHADSLTTNNNLTHTERDKTTDDTDLHGNLKTKTNGIIIPPRDAEALYEAMKLMVTDDNMREAMAKNARQMIESRFEQGFVRKCLYDFYEDILDS